MNGKDSETGKVTNIMKCAVKFSVLLALAACNHLLQAQDYKSDQEYQKFKTYIVYTNGNSGQLQLLVMCIDRGDVVILDQLLDAVPRFANVDEGMSACSPVFWAAFRGNTNIMEILVKHGADVKKKGTNWGITALHIARDAQTVEFLLSHGADIEAKEVHGQTPLMWAAKRGNLEVSNVLIKHGARLGTKDKMGWTALEFAQCLSHTNVVALLAAKGAAPSRKAKDDFPFDAVAGSFLMYGTNHPFAQDTLVYESIRISNGRPVEIKK